MNLWQKFILAVGAFCLVLALAFPPMHLVTERKPIKELYPSGRGLYPTYISVKRVDTEQQIFRFVVIITITGAGILIAAPRRRKEETPNDN
ncbi:MAG: hypothetical protein STSR0004_00030 [Peptococcaceae bacterium]